MQKNIESLGRELLAVVSRTDADAVKIFELARQGASFEERDKQGRSAREIALSNRRLDIVKMLDGISAERQWAADYAEAKQSILETSDTMLDRIRKRIVELDLDRADDIIRQRVFVLREKKILEQKKLKEAFEAKRKLEALSSPHIREDISVPATIKIRKRTQDGKN